MFIEALGFRFELPEGDVTPEVSIQELSKLKRLRAEFAAA